MKLIYIKDVVTLKLDSDKCTGCGKCTEVCPHGIFTIENKKAVVNNRDLCIECGACQQNCAFDAVSVNKGVGCASAMINGIITKGNADLGSCGCGENTDSCC